VKARSVALAVADCDLGDFSFDDVTLRFADGASEGLPVDPATRLFPWSGSGSVEPSSIVASGPNGTSKCALSEADKLEPTDDVDMRIPCASIVALESWMLDEAPDEPIS
jgi:hypothetical protein